MYLTVDPALLQNTNTTKRDATKVGIPSESANYFEIFFTINGIFYITRIILAYFVLINILFTYLCLNKIENHEHPHSLCPVAGLYR